MGAPCGVQSTPWGHSQVTMATLILGQVSGKSLATQQGGRDEKVDRVGRPTSPRGHSDPLHYHRHVQYAGNGRSFGGDQQTALCLKKYK